MACIEATDSFAWVADRAQSTIYFDHAIDGGGAASEMASASSLGRRWMRRTGDEQWTAERWAFKE
jgi:hypothetical protein